MVMENFQNVLELIGRNPQAVLYVLILVLMWTWESIAPFFRRSPQRVRHAVRNLIVALFNGIVLGAIFAGITGQVVEYAASQRIGLLHVFILPPALHAVAAFMMFDCWIYLWHRINHTVPFFWRFHRMHHSDNEMDTTSAARFHLGEILFSMILRLPVIAIIGVPMWVLLVYDTVLLTSTQFHHANVALSDRLDKALRLIVVSPFMHKVHHSRVKPETDSNFSSVLSVWDRIFGSYREKENYREIQLGLVGFDGTERQTLKGLFTTPFLSSRSSLQMDSTPTA
jgi:sterol desaturase/sphingolipid hydroxylase (fatty acid hydroxylase superfamily)